MKSLFLILFFISNLFAVDIKIKNSTIENGRTIFIEFKKEKGVKYKNIEFLKHSYPIYENPVDKSKLYALVPVSYYTKPDIKELKVVYDVAKKTNTAFFMIEIKDAHYKKESIKVSAKKVNPTSKKVQKRISKEYANAMKIYNTFSKHNYITSKFIIPLNTKITSEFGKARVYNGTLKGYHSGVDFRAKKPTPIKCANDGKVVLAKDRFYAGNSVIIDHGHGVYSCYYHLSKFKVKKGNIVKKGQIIGLSGSTGRITGPHLHFAIRVEGTQVDPLEFIKTINKNIFNGDNK